jgi:hypothetical protein
MVGSPVLQDREEESVQARSVWLEELTWAEAEPILADDPHS